jgi:Tol biopolymer transport system component
MRDRILVAQPFDENEYRMRGGAIPIAANVDYVPAWENAVFSVSNNGALAYKSGAFRRRQLIWFDRTGKQVGKVGEPAKYWGRPRISPAGKHIAIGRVDADDRNSDIWLFDVARGVGAPFTSTAYWQQNPIWAPDSSALIYTSNRDGVDALYRRSVQSAAPEEAVVKSKFDTNAADWSRNGYLLTTPATPRRRAISG